VTRRVLVTGGAGYVGSVVVEQLVAAGVEVAVLDDLSRGHREAILPGVEFVHGGVGDAGALRRVFAAGPFDAVVHLAAFALVAAAQTLAGTLPDAISLGGTAVLILGWAAVLLGARPKRGQGLPVDMGVGVG